MTKTSQKHDRFSLLSREAAGRFPRAPLALLLLAVATGFGPTAMAQAPVLSIAVENASGGDIDGLPGGGRCADRCVTAIPVPMRVDLLAEAHRGYRFAGWTGACEDTLGPLCTLKVSGNNDLSARFVAEQESAERAQAVLLLHGDGETPAAWNKVADRQFGGDCPTLYGGVALSHSAALRPPEALRCYRLRFGYVAALTGGAASVPQFQGEIRAALAALLDAHPKIKVVLAGRGRALSAARNFLATPTPERRAVSGVLPVAAAPGPRAEPLPPKTPGIGEGQIGTAAMRLLSPH